jgi:hypothetical protein
MKWLVGWGIVFVLSWGLGAIVCGVTLFMKKYKTTMIAAFVFFALPLLGLGADVINQKRLLYNFERAKEEVARLCVKDGGDKIYRTVENVWGVFQMRARQPESYRRPDGTFYYAMRDQYGMEDPYGRAQGDRDDLAGSVGGSTVYPEVPKGEYGYWFIEQQSKQDSPVGSGYRRSYLSVVENPPEWRVRANKGNPVYEVKPMIVSKLLSRYGYVTEDLTTKEMRDNWIGAGHIKIVDLQTNELLAERKGYFRATGDLLPASGIRWSRSVGCPNKGPSVGHFLHSVLKPMRGYPTTEQLELIAKD